MLMFGSVAAGQSGDRATVQLRSGDKVSGVLEDLEGGTVYVRVSINDQRKIPMGDVALIDRVGGATGLPESELSVARGNAPIVVLANGTSLEATLTDIVGGDGSADPGKPREFVFRTPNGAERRIAAAEVGRVYNGNYPGPPPATPAAQPARGRDVRVSAQERWVDTGLMVRAGQEVGFTTTGQVRLSAGDADVASPAGGQRTAGNAPMPAAPAGALIGRIGPTGQAFAIGNLSSVVMPGTGRLYLGVNDDELSDNSGAYEVVLRPSGS